MIFYRTLMTFSVLYDFYPYENPFTLQQWLVIIEGPLFLILCISVFIADKKGRL